MAASLALTSQLAVPAAAHADSRPGQTSADPIAAIASARAQARQSGKPVGIPALTTATETVAANPSGTLTVTESVYPTHVRRGSSWAPVDTTLHSAADGRFAPAAVPSGIAFSGGGSGPLATMTSRGREFSVTWPDPLPKPVVSGSSAVYPEVLPGVDLTVTATALGGFTEVLTVKNAIAAVNPELASLTLNTHTLGLTLHSDGGGNLTAVDPTGQPYFSSPSPVMWDSSSAAEQAGSDTAASPAAGAKSAAPPVQAVSNVHGPGATAHVAQISARFSHGRLVIAPDTGVLRGAGTHYPVFIDPGWNPNYAADPKQYYDEVQQGCPTKNALNSSTAPYDTPGVGLNDYSGCIGIERAYYQFKVDTRLWNSTATPVTIVNATLKATEAYSASCSVTANVNAYLSGGISTSTTWNNQPTLSTLQDTQSFGPACTSNPSQGFDVSNAVTSASKGHWNAVAFSLRAADESNDLNFKRFANNPTVTVEYNTTPKVSSTSTSPPSTCSGGTTIGNTTIGVHASIKDPDDGSPVYANFTLKNSAGSVIKSATQQGPVIESGTLTWTVGTLASGTYTWTVTATDLRDTSSPTTCKFTVDATAPVRPAINSPSYPLTDSGTSDPRLSNGGEFDFSDTSADTAAFAYNWGSPPPTVNPPHTVAAASDGTAKVTLYPNGLYNVLYVVAIDTAGNQSPPNTYDFALAQPTTEPPVGDVTGDGHPDLVVPGSDGTLRLYPGTGSGRLTTPVEYATGFDFHHALVSTGDFDWNFTQDVIARQSDGNAYVYPGNGDAEPDSIDPNQRVQVQSSSDMPFTWADVTQLVVAGGSVTSGVPGDVDGDGNGPDMFATTIDGTLWLLSAGSAKGSVQYITQLNTGWSGKTIIDAQNIVTSQSATAYPALWVRNDATGELDLYPGADNVIAGSPASAAILIKSTTVLTAAAYPQLFTAGDTNGDGNPDLWAADASAAHNITYLASGASAGTLTSPVHVHSLVPAHDYNGDGIDDVHLWYDYGASTCTSIDHTRMFAMSGSTNGSGSLAWPASIWDDTCWGTGTQFVSPGDFNGDGQTDIAVFYDYQSNGSTCTGVDHVALWTFLADTNGTLKSGKKVWDNTCWGSGTTFMSAGDFNGDGTSDIALMYTYSSTHVTMFNMTADTSGSGTLASPVNRWDDTTWGTGSRYLSAGDFNGDGKSDLALYYEHGSGHDTLYTFTAHTNGDGGLSGNTTAWDSTTFGDNTAFMTAGDYNGDGTSDIGLLYDYGSGHVRLYTMAAGTGGTIASPVNRWDDTVWGTGTAFMTVGDYNGDGTSDIGLVYDHGSGHLTLATLTTATNGSVASPVTRWDDTSWGTGTRFAN